MRLPLLLSASGLLLALSNLLGGTVLDSQSAPITEAEAKKWELSLSSGTYFVKDGPDFVNPTITADRDWLHLEARYNYEALNTGSLWLGYNLSFGEKLAFGVTPMVGGVFGDICGVAPGYKITVNYKMFELYTLGQYFIDDTTHEENFFYTWSELTCSPVDWFKFGLVVDRTKLAVENFDIRRGPLVGFKYKCLDFSVYWLNPGSSDETVLLYTALNF